MKFGGKITIALAGVATLLGVASAPNAKAQDKPNIVMLMTDDTGWNDFGAYSGGGMSLGHPTPNIDKMAKEGAVFTSWYGQASCTAGRASFITGRIPIRSALSIVVAPGDENFLRKETPTIAEYFKKNGYTTYFSGKWHLGDKPAAKLPCHRNPFQGSLIGISEPERKAAGQYQPRVISEPTGT
jgi:arylsulfatase A-like enzyme